MFRDHCERPFRFITIITDAPSVNSLWYRAPSDRFVVCDDETAEVLQRAGVEQSTIAPLGFPVSPLFATPPKNLPAQPLPCQRLRVLYVINTGKKKCGKAIDRLLEIPEVELTITVGRYAELKEKLARRAREYDGRLHLHHGPLDRSAPVDRQARAAHALHPKLRPVEEYFEVIAREARRAMRRYGMLVLTGLEFNKDGPTKKSSAHLLGVDLHAPISPRLDLLETIQRIHAQGGLAVAAHPHVMKSEWTKDTLYLWDRRKSSRRVIDAWEIANRNNLFMPVSLRRLPFLANSDFHKPKHIYSWKTLLNCEKEAEAIKECIRRNEHVYITLYRRERTPAPAEVAAPALEQARLLFGRSPAGTERLAVKRLSTATPQ